MSGPYLQDRLLKENATVAEKNASGKEPEETLSKPGAVPGQAGSDKSLGNAGPSFQPPVDEPDAVDVLLRHSRTVDKVKMDNAVNASN